MGGGELFSLLMAASVSSPLSWALNLACSLLGAVCWGNCPANYIDYAREAQRASLNLGGVMEGFLEEVVPKQSLEG